MSKPEATEARKNSLRRPEEVVRTIIDLNISLNWPLKSQGGVGPSFWTFITGRFLGGLMVCWIARNIQYRWSLSYCFQAVVSGHLLLMLCLYILSLCELLLNNRFTLMDKD